LQTPSGNSHRRNGTATFDRTAASLDNPDQVAIAIHNYRWRIGLARGEPQYDEIDKRLAESLIITVPTITIEGYANGAPHPEPSSYAKKFTGKYEHRTIKGGIGHNLPQEAPQAFAEAILEVALNGIERTRHKPLITRLDAVDGCVITPFDRPLLLQSLHPRRYQGM